MQVEDISGGIEPVTKSDILALEVWDRPDTWNRPRGPEEYIDFITRRAAALGNLDIDE